MPTITDQLGKGRERKGKERKEASSRSGTKHRAKWTIKRKWNCRVYHHGKAPDTTRAKTDHQW